MFRNYLKIVIRNAAKNRTFSIINIVGLAVGLATCFIIALYVLDDLSFDAQQPRAGRISLFQQFANSSSSGSAFGALLRKQTGIEAVTQVAPHRVLVSKLNFAAYEARFCLADSNLTRLFEFPMVQGQLKEALALPNKVVLSQRMATKYFASTNPVGQTIDVQLTNKITFMVVGIMRNTPENTHLPIDFLASSQNAKTLSNQQPESFWDFAGINYLLLAKNTTLAQLKTQLPAIQQQTRDPNAAAWKLDLIALRDIYLKNRTDDRIRATNAIEFVRIFSAVALCILLLACFNYLNLSSARATLRAREVGVRKTMGAGRRQLIAQFLGESFFFTLIATLLALLSAQIVLPFFNDFAEKSLSIIQLFTPLRFGVLVGFVVLTSLLTGLYPAFVLSGFNPVRVLKNQLLPKSSAAYFRRGLVVFQFAVSVVMLVATLVVMSQLNYLQHKDLGYQRAQILTLNLPTQATDNQRNALQEDLKQQAVVKDITRVSILPGNGFSFNKVSPQSLKSKNEDPTIGQLYVDTQFQSVFGVKTVEGRFFEKNNTADRSHFVVNREATKKFGWKLGQTIGYTTYQYNPDGSYAEVPVNGQIVGVVDNYHQMDLKSSIFPLMMINGGNWGQFAVKLQGKNLAATIQKVGEAWKKQFPDYPFEYKFLDDEFDQSYRKEAQTSRVFALFAALAIFISCLGLLGLVTFAAEQRTKEIGVRKVLGASVSSIVTLLSKDFLKLVLIAIVIASPIAWYAMHVWLQDFAYKISIEWWVFALAGLLAVGIALLTVSFQSVKAALMNPVKSLRSE